MDPKFLILINELDILVIINYSLYIWIFHKISKTFYLIGRFIFLKEPKISIKILFNTSTDLN